VSPLVPRARSDGPPQHALVTTVGTDWIMIVFPIGHVAVGIGIGYRARAGLLNRTFITVTPTAVTGRHAPLPWTGQRNLAADTVTQAYCVQKVQNTKNGTSTTYDVHANLTDGSWSRGCPTSTRPSTSSKKWSAHSRSRTSPCRARWIAEGLAGTCRLP
jgi:hypothetical protein